jgi:hypothetical protein
VPAIRYAIDYIRHSSTYQLAHNTESRRMQYAMQDRVRAFGWTDVEAIDDDLVCSAAGTTTRTGLERMVLDVCLGIAGVVSTREVSHFGRNCREARREKGEPRGVGPAGLAGFIKTADGQDEFDADKRCPECLGWNETTLRVIAEREFPRQPQTKLLRLTSNSTTAACHDGSAVGSSITRHLSAVSGLLCEER